MEKNKYFALLSNDVETTSIWFNDLRNETGEKVMCEGMPRLLDLYAKYNVRSTFFYTAYMAELFPESVKMAADAGHEIGSHGKSHIKENGFDIMPFERQKSHLEYSKKLLEDISGQEVISFRAPALRVSPITARALIETGFEIDSSIASQRFDFFLSFGSKQKLSFLNAPRLPYRVKEDDIFKRGQSKLVELPLSALLLPYVGTTMRMMPSLTRMQQRILHFETGINSKPAVFLHDADLGLTNDMADNGLLFQYSAEASDQKLAISKAKKIAILENKSEFLQKRENMLKDKIDVTAFMLWLAENYPKSVEDLKKRRVGWEQFK